MSENVKCIFCLEEKKGTEEHIFPDSLGGLLVTYDVCKVCNDELGRKVDSHLVNHIVMQFARMTKKIKGKSGKIPNPLSKGKLDDGSEVHYKFNDDGEPESLYSVPRQSLSEDENSIKFSVDSIDKDKLFQMVNKTLKRKGKQPLSHEEFESNLKYGKIESPSIEYLYDIDHELYRKAILKVIYGYTYFVLGPSYLEDPLAKILREYLKSDSLDVEGLNGDAGRVDKENPKIPGLQELANEDSHIACLIKDENRIFCYVNIFNVFEGFMLVSNNADAYESCENVLLTNNVVEKSLVESIIEIEQ